jgi:hypothetical protein
MKNPSLGRYSHKKALWRRGCFDALAGLKSRCSRCIASGFGVKDKSAREVRKRQISSSTPRHALSCLVVPWGDGWCAPRCIWLRSLDQAAGLGRS